MNISIIPVNLGFVKSFLIKGDKTIIVDAGLKGSSTRILKAMQANGIKPADISLLLVTHVHADHTGGLRELKELTGAPVAVHVSEAGFLKEGKSAPVMLHSRFMKILSVFFKGQTIGGVQPDILIEGRMDLNPYGVDGIVLPTPGHTEGSLTLVTAGGEAIAGDMVGGVKRASLPGVYSDLNALKASVSGLADHMIQKVHTSHGRMFEINDVLKLGQ